jgi:hypothetical protein
MVRIRRGTQRNLRRPEVTPLTPDINNASTAPIRVAKNAAEMARITVEIITGIEVTTLEKATSMEPSATSSNTAMNTGM